jgi:ATP-binding cassette, subfamily B, bacterial
MNKKIDTKKILKNINFYNSRYKKLYYFVILGSIFGVLFQDILAPFVVSRAFLKLQIAYSSHLSISFGYLLPYVIWFVVFMILGLVIWRLQGLGAWFFESKVHRNMSEDAFLVLENKGQNFHANRFSGSLVNQVNKYIRGHERIMDDLFWNIIPGIVTILGSMIVLCIVAIKFAAIILAVIIVYIFVIYRRVRYAQKFNIDVSKAESRRTAELADAITNISNVRAFANEEYELKRFKKATKSVHYYHGLLSIEVFKNEVISHFMTNFFRIIAFIYGVYAVTSLHANASVLFLVITYSTAIVSQLMNFGRIVRNINQALSDSQEMLDTLEVENEIKDPVSPIESNIHRGDISFKNISFTHNENSKALFRNFSVHIKPGEKIGLVGPSGSGKTTFINLLLRTIDVDKGSIEIDYQNIKSIKQHDLRRAITYVAQEPILFHRTIAENIGYGDLEANHKAVVAAAKLANAHEFISGLPKGYDTLVGERGVKLSGGQRQRIAIARAILKNSPILILDEATSALDSENEAIIQDALKKLIKDRTAIIIAHRLSTIKEVDRILVISEGKIIEEGSHKELLRKNNIYAKLWNRQSGGFTKNFSL